ncbi:MAG: response regulator [Candidatus Zapsychrus exili]|nr:response regulator [Candidatus Zapsychrus exili]
MKQKKVMIIDDNREFLKQFSETLKLCGYEPCVFSRPKTAIKQIAKIKPDILLLDICLGDESGIDVAKELRSNEKTKDLKIIAITAFYEERDYKVLREECKVKTCLKKPLKPLEVISAIEDNLKKNMKRK